MAGTLLPAQFTLYGLDLTAGSPWPDGLNAGLKKLNDIRPTRLPTQRTTMQQQQVMKSGRASMFSEKYELDYLVNRYGIARATARKILEENFGDRQTIESLAERIGRHDRPGTPAAF